MSGFGKPPRLCGVEQRRAERRPVQWNARIVFDDRSAQQCLIRDVSDQGARLEVASILGIPDRFILRAGSGQLSALVVWRAFGSSA